MSASILKARDATERRDWAGARRHYADAIGAGDALGADDLAALAWAHAWTGDLDAGIQSWERALDGYAAVGRWDDAAVAAFWVAWWHVDKGSGALAAAWYRRLDRLAEDHPSPRTRGYATLVRAWEAYGRGDLLDRGTLSAGFIQPSA